MNTKEIEHNAMYRRRKWIYRSVLAAAVLALAVQGVIMIFNDVSILAVAIPDALILLFGRFAYVMGRHSASGQSWNASGGSA